ncbi:MAG TPA: radical SAM protein, partial [Bacillota bacterium]|nr:radical SAM protein [Bacillota bacterium]
MSDTKKVAIITNNLVCEMNTKYYSSTEKYFILNGWEVTTSFNADLLVMVTCGFSDEMFHIIRRLLQELNLQNFPAGNIIIMGCQPKTHRAELMEVFPGTLLEFGQEDQLDRLINATVPFSTVTGTNVFKAPGQECTGDREELFNIQIEDGCLKQCTFCVINKAHGDLRSMPLPEIMAQFDQAIQSGYRNINLVGVDTFGYGYDTGTNVVELIEAMLKTDSNIKFYLGSLHARWLTKYWEGILNLCRRGVIDSLHIVIQHNNDEILKRMGRPIKFADIYTIIKRFKQECPDLFISTDLIVGFPGETREIFMEMMDFIKNDRC